MKKALRLLIFVISCSIYPQTVLVFGGKTGWFGKIIVNLINDLGHKAVSAISRVENRESVIKEIEEIRPDCVINSAGITGDPKNILSNIDWCEDNKQHTFRVNIIGALNVADICWQRGIHLTHIGTGCLYDYDKLHPKFTSNGFKESDEPNHYSSYYCRTKVYLEKLLFEPYGKNILHLRIRMPVTHDWQPRNFVCKLVRYGKNGKVINEPNSLTMLEDLLPIAVDMTLKGIKGNFNFVNPGVITHNEILQLYKEIVDPSFTWRNFTVEEQDKILKAARSNCELDTAKLLDLYPDIPNIKRSVINALKDMKRLKDSRLNLSYA